MLTASTILATLDTASIVVLLPLAFLIWRRFYR